MGSNMGMKEFPLLVKVQRSNVQTGSDKSKIYFTLYYQVLHYSLLKKLHQKVNHFMKL